MCCDKHCHSLLFREVDDSSHSGSLSPPLTTPIRAYLYIEMSGPFHRASNFKIDNLEIVQANTVTYAGKSALERLEEHISPGAAHNSDERCDAPKCHPETRAAVQDEILSWITEGDSDAEPKRLLWLTGPAGTGKTAIAGSVAETCSEQGLLAATFFFSSFSGSADRRSKAFFVPTLAYQLRKHTSLQSVGKAILSAIDNDPAIFRTRLKDQFTELILKPFRQLHAQYDTSTIPKVIIIDGVDECEPLSPPHRPFTKEEAQIAREKGHLEVLNLLLDAVRDPAFPFRIVIVSRPERQFTTFLTETASNTTLKLFLDDKYNPDADIELFLNAKFAEMRRRYHLPTSWPTPEQMSTLVAKASGQFIYAATALRFIGDGAQLPQVQLNIVLGLVIENHSERNPFQELDALYLHILRACPDPMATAEWITAVDGEWHLRRLPAHFWRQFIEWVPGEMERFLGCIPSLLFLPPPEDRQSPIRVYHKSLHDFLTTRNSTLVSVFIKIYGPPHQWPRNSVGRVFRIIQNKGPVIPACTQQDHEEFLAHFLSISIAFWSRVKTSEDKRIFLSSDARWWIDRYLDADERGVESMWYLLDRVHDPLTHITRIHQLFKCLSGYPSTFIVYIDLKYRAKYPRILLLRLEEHISPGAAHNSDERCDAPKCHPETRAAVQDEILSWITDGDGDAEPKRLLWLTGPAGTGKTAIAGSIAETCSEQGLLAASFFFSSFSGSADRRSKTCLVPTLAYQLRKLPGLQGVSKAVLLSIENDPAIFMTRLKDQFTELILKPFKQYHGQYDASNLPKVIIIDGVDECEPSTPLDKPITKDEAQIAREKEHLEILNVLLDAARDPAFPFRIVVVSRPEHQFTAFFSEIASSTRKLFLDDRYNPDADIEMFLQAKFAEIRRRYHLPASWPTQEQIAALVSNASGQFITAATVIRFVNTRAHLPQEQLDCVLNLQGENEGSVLTSNPLQTLDALYLHILGTCPDPVATVAWIRAY
ncbi:hypothetical protein D9611_006686 [Ephemerocybe angulata]|uniref:NACHT domain-containing protein n=1 Tax=Ephemerocybe angulata TaxID=980116 RepID=A0A8H5C7Q6_9AGAR|nr:hypothetical protein D9611_006686 [Tulosesus angulatus]